eukprot:comp16805_c0_seq1/m.15199 comp16805_c0_seq1/g.15199  ORF comp16805_c0_seq1/g.15199 comp16805_c0_seq1/m.15199 type:complete len:461 (-) comp16805_c0_seq1:725-2107(-)
MPPSVANDVEGENMEVDQHAAPPTASTGGQEGDFPDLLRQYYLRFFPFNEYFQWLNYGATGQFKFENREFCFTMKDDIFVRYKSFGDLKEFKQAVQAEQPYKIDVGAVFNAKPKEYKTIKAGQFKAMEKELVFDIDMTDYDDIRTCCEGATICSSCWAYMTGAIKVLDDALREDFGFEHLLWVYSGRRGVHCWVCDQRARKMSNEERSAVAEYLNVVKGGDQQSKKVILTFPLHPSVKRAVDTLKKYFHSTVLGKQNLLASEKHAKDMLACVPDEGVRKLIETWDFSEKGSSVSEERWEEIEKEVSKAIKRKEPNRWQLEKCLQEIILQYTYPRLDINVSKQTNHLLKGPFCVHPKTGRVCVPIDIDEVDDFNPFAVPTVSELLRQLHEYDATHSPSAMDEDSDAEEDDNNGGRRRLSDYKKTEMHDYVKQFKGFLGGIQDEIRILNREKQMEQARTMDF